MRLQPRHYILLAILIALAFWNVVRVRRAHEANTVPLGARAAVPNSPAWQAFDRAAALRDAPEGQFAPALDALHAQTEAAAEPESSDLRGCQLWLSYYRHSVPMASGKSGNWAMLAAGHVQSCVTTHRDTGR